MAWPGSAGGRSGAGVMPGSVGGGPAPSPAPSGLSFSPVPLRAPVPLVYPVAVSHASFENKICPERRSVLLASLSGRVEQRGGV